MATEQIALRPAGLRFPFVAILIVIAFAIGTVAGVGLLSAVTSTSLVAVHPGPTVATDTDQNSMSRAAYNATHAAAAPVVNRIGCKAIEPTSYTVYCNPATDMSAAVYSPTTRATAPLANWQACQAMDETAYRMYCDPNGR